MKIRIEPYKTWSGGAKALGKRCGILRTTALQVKRHGDFDFIINWGRSERRFNGHYINEPEKVRVASDKLRCVKVFAEAHIPTPEGTTSRDVASSWLSDGETVIARTLLRASGGRGIHLCDPEKGETLREAPLYTKYVKKTDEYRVHVWQGEVIDVQQKRRNTAVADGDVNWQIRNHDNGFIYARSSLNPPGDLHSTAISAVAALVLDFGAVDLGYNKKHKVCTVYEVNTAPGLEGVTLDSYYRAILKTYPQIGHGIYERRRRTRIS